jgi:electron transfer flavoprotein beta subunit
MPLPALLTIQSGINQLRYATLKGIMAAKKKEIRTVPAPAGLTPLVEIRHLAVPEKQKQTRLIPGTPAEAAKELVRALRDARVVEGGA